ncbi:MAG TPA: hypothetical protein VGR90_06720, partial [Acidimicrobiales bacterium]|nr:hypothetical protein [Acidimicrobiales bacterium]
MRPTRKFNRKVAIGAAAASALTLGLAVPAIAGGGSTSDNPGHNEACGTTAAGATSCLSSIQAAVNYAGAGGTVNVGEGTFDEHVSIPYGLTLRGSGNATQIEGDLSAPLINDNTTAVTTNTPPLTIEDLTLKASSATGSAAQPGYLMVVKDRNSGNLDRISNITFTEDKPALRDYGLDNENSTAALAITSNTFHGMGVGVLIDVNSASSSGNLGADLVTANDFDQLATFGTKLPKGIALSINTSSGNPSAGAQVFDGNVFNYKGGTAISVAGSGPVGVVSSHDDNFQGQDYGVNNMSTNPS